ncbi:MAG: hypothetical protein ACRESE_00785, partial [Gammaproteobacteria bacterium]
MHREPCNRTAFAGLCLAVIFLTLAGCGGGGGSTTGTGTGGGQTPPPPVPGSAVNVLTYHNDNARDGLNDQESILTPAKVNATDFGKINFYPADGKVDAQPLYVSNLAVAGSAHNVLYVATEHDSVYA